MDRAVDSSSISRIRYRTPNTRRQRVELSDAALSAYAAGVLELLTHLGEELAIDLNRVYLVGQSLGGFGVWDLVAKRPDFFAAAVPLCGGGDLTRIIAARRLPIWAFHGAQDRTVPVDHSREMVAALQAVGDSVKYTEYPDAGHDVWKRAFSEPLLAEWLFAQTRRRD
jgi:predicted peptidase